MNDHNTLLRHIDDNFDASLSRLSELLRIPSVGTDPQFDPDTRKAAQWICDQLTTLGFEASLRETDGQPMVVGHSRDAGEQASTLLYYGHYDVQPADPLELWESPPFEPSIVPSEHGRKIVARGAVDDKGQLMTWLEAFRSWRETFGRFPVNIKILCEGEEESSSKSMVPFLTANKDELSADICVISDTGMLGVDQPAVTTVLRGMVYLEVALEGPSHDLHSGMYGGVALNPVHALSSIITALHDSAGKIQVDGFYDGILEPSASQIADWNAIDKSETGFLAAIGLTRSHGEAGRSWLEQIWARPCLDVNGIWGGYTGEGSKTVIPSKAHAKLSCRLVPGQDSGKIMASLKKFFVDHAPADAKLTFCPHGRSDAVNVPSDTPFIKAARDAAKIVFGRDATLIGCGGSIPVVTSLKTHLGMDSLLLGFSLDDDRIHSPNEKFDLKCYERGIKTHAAFLHNLANQS